VIRDLIDQEGPGGTFLAGVGMAGKNHWSVAIQPLPNKAAIDFDYACRVKEQPQWLGSTYTVLSADWHVESMNCLTLQVGDSIIRCETLTEHSECRLVESDQLSIVAKTETAGELPRTIRWKYRFSVA
jgi:hypothetical protein